MKNYKDEEKYVLVVEDDFDLLWMIKKLLDLHNVPILTAVTGEQAIEQFSRHFFQIRAVVLDLSLPDINGEILAEEFFKLDKNLPIIITTGSEDRSQRNRLEKLGVTAYLIKPFDLTKIIDILTEYV